MVRGFHLKLVLCLSAVPFFLACAAKRQPPVSLSRTPVVYAAYFNPKALTAEQRGEIESVINQMVEPREPWFVYVRYHRRDRLRVNVYFPPVDGAADLRRGEVLRSPGFGSFSDQKKFCKAVGSDWPVIGEYIQIKEQGAGWPQAPEVSALPFSAPEEFSEAELIHAVSFAREAARRYRADEANRLKRPEPVYILSGDIDTMPFQCILENGDGSINVYFGWQVAPNIGWGISVGLEKQVAGEGYRVTGMGNWLS